VKFTNVVWIYKDQYHLLNEMQNWCRDNLGVGGYIVCPDPGRDTWHIETVFGNSRFCFLRDQDATLFSLRWLKIK
jgi:hypothetical protein